MKETEDQTVPFGKYKGQSVDVLLADQSYLDWMAAQPEIVEYLQASHPELFTVISRRTDQDSVEHNRLQAKFLNNEFAWAFKKAAEAKPLKHNDEEWRNERWYLDFECGCDVRIWAKAPMHDEPTQEFRIEIKPALGDDYPSVLRQMKRHKSNILLVGNFSSRACSLEQVKKIFWYAGIKMLFFSECEALMEDHGPVGHQ